MFGLVNNNTSTLFVSAGETISNISIDELKQKLEKPASLVARAKDNKDKIKAFKILRKPMAKIQAANVVNN